MKKHIHLIGIGGTGLSAIARVLLEEGYTVSGSDRVASPLFNAITAAGAHTFLGHAPEQISGADVVIRSSAVADDNPEILAANAHGIPVLKRAAFLEELTKGKDTLAIAGSHGKTTTTALLIWILDQLEVAPSFIAGGMVSQLGCNARAGKGQYFVIEADEYDYMFLGLSPKIAVITNIEHDHADCFPTPADYLAAFRAFLNRVRPDGLALLCADDPQTLALKKEMQTADLQIFTYGTSPAADYRVEEITLVEGLPRFTLNFYPSGGAKQSLGTVSLKIPGHHNLLNAAAALATIHQLGLPMENAIAAASTFTGAGRRFEILGTADGITLIDDYGHHPTEIAAALEAARSRYPTSRLWAVWQPHSYSRTKTLENDFMQALKAADKIVVLPIYAAREADPGYSSEQVAAALPSEKTAYIPDFKSAADFLVENLAPGDVVIVLSAGDAWKISQTVLTGLQKRSNTPRGA